MAKEKPKKDMAWESSVSEYLSAHPDFFERHPMLLDQMTIPHAGRGQAISLIERQVDRMRRQNEDLRQELHELVSNARENDMLATRLHELMLALSAAQDLDQAVDTLRALLQERFALDGVYVRLGMAGLPKTRPEYTDRSDPLLKDLLALVTKRPYCGAPDKLWGQKLFGAKAEALKSVAVASLVPRESAGVIVLASHEPDHFVAGMATDYLQRLGEMMGVQVMRLSKVHAS